MLALHAFFDEYRTTFVRLDRDALMQFFALPIQVVSASGSGVTISVSDGDEWAAVLDGLLAAYRSLRVADAQVLDSEVMPVTPAMASARVRWCLRADDGTFIYDFTALYTIAEIDGAPRITGIAHDELPKLQAAMAERDRRT